MVNQPVEQVEESKLSDLILGGQDGIVNVLGVVLGVASAGADVRMVLVAGLAAAFAESVSMAAVSYTSQLADRDFYQKEYAREKRDIELQPEIERAELQLIYAHKGFQGELLNQIVEKISSDKDVFLNHMMREHLGLEPVENKNVLKDTLIVGLSAIVGSFVPLLPFIFIPQGNPILLSAFLSALVLFIVGVYQAKTYVGNWLKKGLQMVLIGMGAALVGYVIGKLFQI